MKIKQVEKLLQMNAQTIRYYEKLGFLNPQRDENGYRNYSEDDLKILKRIRFLRELDISLDMIGMIIKNPETFQTIIEAHIKAVKAQAEHLENIQKICESINYENIPLLDAIIDGQFQDIPEVSTSKLKKLFHKSKEYMKPYPVVTLGKKTTPYQLLKKLFIDIIGSIAIVILWKFILQKFYAIHLSFMVMIILIVLISLFVMIVTFYEKYYEFRDFDFYIYDHHYQNKIKAMFAVLKNQTTKYAKHYRYDEIKKVTITIEKFYSSIGFGINKCFKIVYHFQMKNGEHFTINTSIYNNSDQKRKTVLDILEYHLIAIEDQQNFKAALLQDQTSVYDYLDKHL